MFEISLLPARLMDAAIRRRFEMEQRHSKTPRQHSGGARTPNLGERVVLHDVEGLLVADLRAGVFAPDYSREDWSHLDDGYLVLDDTAGLVHVGSDDRPCRVVAPATSAGGAGLRGENDVLAAIRLRLVEYNGRSPSILSETAVQFRDHADFLPAVVQLAGDSDRMVSEGATWILKSELEAGRKLDAEQTSRLIAQRDQITAWQAQLHLCQVVKYLDVPEACHDALGPWLEKLLEAERPFLRAWALDGLCQLPDTPVGAHLDRMADDPSASVRSRVNNLRRKLAKRRGV